MAIGVGAPHVQPGAARIRKGKRPAANRIYERVFRRIHAIHPTSPRIGNGKIGMHRLRHLERTVAGIFAGHRHNKPISEVYRHGEREIVRKLPAGAGIRFQPQDQFAVGPRVPLGSNDLEIVVARDAVPPRPFRPEVCEPRPAQGHPDSAGFRREEHLLAADRDIRHYARAVCIDGDGSHRISDRNNSAEQSCRHLASFSAKPPQAMQPCVFISTTPQAGRTSRMRAVFRPPLRQPACRLRAGAQKIRMMRRVDR